MYYRLFLVIVFSFCSHYGSSQETPRDSVPKTVIDTLETVVTDSIPDLLQNPSSLDSEEKGKVEKKKKSRAFKGPMSMFAGNPGRAALYSLILPGAGQFYNKKYWKIPFVWAAEGVAIGVLIFNVDRYNAWDQALQLKLEDASSNERTAEEIIDIRDKARKQRDYSIVALTIVHIIQIADAFVHRHLIEFDVSDDLSLDIGTPAQLPGIGITYTF